MNNNKPMRHMYFLLFVIFLAMAGYFAHMVLVQAPDFVANPFNARVHAGNPGIMRGRIYDANGIILAESLLADGVYSREYPFGAAFAHVVGFSDVSNSGLELSRNFQLYRINRELTQRVRNAIFDESIEANSIFTTLHAPLQLALHEGMGAGGGAAVAISPASGEILAMVATPGFDPNLIAQNWPALSADDRAPLLNRATAGLYPPGSIFKIITALAALEYGISPDFYIDCAGRALFDGNNIQCHNQHAHGRTDMAAAMVYSCNIYFAALAQKIGAAPIAEMAARLGFGEAPAFELGAAAPLFPMAADASIAELVETAFGQGRTLTNPLHMAILAAALANNGMAMNPFIVSHGETPRGTSVFCNLPRQAGQIIPAEHIDIINQMLADVVIYGTGRPAHHSDIQISGKTGTAENPAGPAHSWFMGFAPADAPQIAIAIIIEHTGGGPRATQLAREAIATFLNN
ncbi:MAG: penicillin-binding transpeptidase domain-containing protein [Defluviitaleaceae bacterium]|nr:penicillin-binding transpeptidase domain-containing protein [Defluviitaleaceae bacterium]